MKKMILLGLLTVLLAQMVWGQEKVEAPVWNVGDKWVFTQGNMEVVGTDQNSYTLKFSDDICLFERQGLNLIIIDKSTFNRIYAFEGTKRKKYTWGRAKILNFPIFAGKEWKSGFSATALTETASAFREVCDNYESFRVLGWEDVDVPAGKVKTAKMEYIQHTYRCNFAPAVDAKRKTIYWYSPDTKYFVRAKYDYQSKEGKDWDLNSFKLKK